MQLNVAIILAHHNIIDANPCVCVCTNKKLKYYNFSPNLFNNVYFFTVTVLTKFYGPSIPIAHSLLYRSI